MVCEMRVVRADAGEGVKEKKNGCEKWGGFIVVPCVFLLPGAVPTFWGDHGFGFGL
jgi:hypothetical protein